MRAWAWVPLLMATVLSGCLGGEADDEDDEVTPSPDDVFARLVWREHDESAMQRTEVAVAAFGQSLWAIGGFSGQGLATRTVQAYDTSADVWRSVPSYPVPIHHTAAVTIDQRVYVLGGYTTNAFVPTGLGFWFDARTNSWNATAPLPTPRGAHAAAVVDGVIYLVGGVGSDGALMRDVHAYNPQTNSWVTRAAIPTPREHLAAVASDGRLYAVGGRMQSLASNSAVTEVYDPVTNRWSEAADAPTARGGITAATYEGRILVFGGEGGDGTFPEVEGYDPAADVWESLEPNPEPRHGLGAGLARGRVYLLLGGPEPGLTVSGTVVSLGR